MFFNKTTIKIENIFVLHQTKYFFKIKRKTQIKTNLGNTPTRTLGRTYIQPFGETNGEISFFSLIDDNTLVCDVFD